MSVLIGTKDHVTLNEANDRERNHSRIGDAYLTASRNCARSGPLPRVVHSTLLGSVAPSHPTKIERRWVKLPEILRSETISIKPAKPKSQSRDN